MKRWNRNGNYLTKARPFFFLLLSILIFISCHEKKIKIMEEPVLPPEEGEKPKAFEYLPMTKKGYIDWVEAIKQGVIKPRESILPKEERKVRKKPMMPALDFNIYFRIKGDIPDVKFPHFPHTMWLDCRNCHPSIFLMQAGKNPITMEKILQGEFCGRCHGRVAFPISDCSRCHSIPK